MELGGDDVVLPDRRAEFKTVVGGGGNDIIIVRHYIIGVDEIDVGTFGDALEGWRPALEAELGPSHLGNFQGFVGNPHVIGKTQHMAGDHIQPLVEPEFYAVGKEQLHTDANPQEGPPLGDDTENRFDKTGLLQVPHAVSKGSHTGQYYPVSLQNDLRISRDNRLGPDLFKTFLNGAEVAHAVINDGDHIISLQSLRSRRSCRTYGQSP